MRAGSSAPHWPPVSPWTRERFRRRATMAPVNPTRVDRWLWAVRLYKSRAASTAACRAGHVHVNGASAKPATLVRVGDRVEAKVHARRRVLEVVRTIDQRVGAAIAAECLVDLSPPPDPADQTPPAVARDRGAGRPTKRERRQLDRFRTR
jgi:ribosome-associated heat shock protein Hsp15